MLVFAFVWVCVCVCERACARVCATRAHHPGVPPCPPSQHRPTIAVRRNATLRHCSPQHTADAHRGGDGRRGGLRGRELALHRLGLSAQERQELALYRSGLHVSFRVFAWECFARAGGRAVQRLQAEAGSASGSGRRRRADSRSLFFLVPSLFGSIVSSVVITTGCSVLFFARAAGQVSGAGGSLFERCKQIADVRTRLAPCM